MRRAMLLLVTMAALAVGPAVAEEIIFFTNGTQMAIRGHSVEGEMVHVDLGDNAFMAFPFEKVERIEKAGENVFLSPSSSSTNKMIKVEPVPGAAPVSGRRGAHKTAWERARSHGTDNESNAVERDPKTGLAVARPYSHSNQHGKRMLAAAGSHAVLGGRYASTPEEGMPGARMLGSGYQLPGVKPPRMYDGNSRLVAIEFKGGATATRRDDAGETASGDEAREEGGRDEDAKP